MEPQTIGTYQNNPAIIDCCHRCFKYFKNQFVDKTLLISPLTIVIIYMFCVIIQKRYVQFYQSFCLISGIVIFITVRFIENERQNYLSSACIVYSLLNSHNIYQHKDAFIFISSQVLMLQFDSIYENDNLNIQILIVISSLLQLIFITLSVLLTKGNKATTLQSIQTNSHDLRKIENILEQFSWLNNHKAFLLDDNRQLLYSFQNKESNVQFKTTLMMESLQQIFIYNEKFMKSDQIIQEISQEEDSVYPNLFQFLGLDDCTFMNIIAISCQKQIFYVVYYQEIAKIDNKLTSLLDITSSISHELSSHLNCVITLSQLYYDNPDLLNQEQKENIIEPILSNSQQLELIINNLKDYGNIQSNNFMSQIQKFDIVFEIFEICDYFKMTIQEKQLQVDFKFNLVYNFIESDRQRFRQIFYQLIQNAVKFTFKNYIQVRVCNEQTLIKIQVTDSGQGMDENEQQQLMEVFRIGKLARVSKKSVGCSLGLHISNLLAKKIGDNRNIQFQSSIKQGSTFRFWIKNYEQTKEIKTYSTLKKISQEQYKDSQLEHLIQAQAIVNDYYSNQRLSVQQRKMVTAENRSNEENISLNYSDDDLMQAKLPPLLQTNVVSQQRHNLKIKLNRIGNCCIKILIVDDEYFNIFALQAFLKQQDHKSEYAFDGQEAINKIKEKLKNPCLQCNSNSYKLIFLDINMPVKDGIQTVREIKEIVPMKRIQNICCAANSAFSDIETKQKAYEAGMDFYLTKPLNLPILKQLINNVFFMKILIICIYVKEIILNNFKTFFTNFNYMIFFNLKFSNFYYSSLNIFLKVSGLLLSPILNQIVYYPQLIVEILSPFQS